MFRISIDVGGTFTDLVALNEETGDIINIKAASIPKNPEKGVIVALRRFLEKHDATSVIMIGHATTIATNALFGQVDLVLPKTALITTEGFKDIIEIGRQRRAEVYNLFFQRPHMLVSRKHRYEVIERVNQNGEVESRLDEKKINEIIDQIQQNDIYTIAVGFLNSYANAVHEIKTNYFD
jgi:N-methylhydantoinase A